MAPVFRIEALDVENRGWQSEPCGLVVSLAQADGERTLCGYDQDLPPYVIEADAGCIPEAIL